MKPNIIKPQQMPLYNFLGYVAHINIFEFNDLRIQARKENVGTVIQNTEWYIQDENLNRYYIMTNGKVDKPFPLGVFDLLVNQMLQLF